MADKQEISYDELLPSTDDEVLIEDDTTVETTQDDPYAELFTYNEEDKEVNPLDLPLTDTEKYALREPTEDAWYDKFPGALFRGAQDQFLNAVEAGMNPIDQVYNVLFGNDSSEIDLDSIHTISDRGYTSGAANLSYTIGQGFSQFASTLGLTAAGAAAGSKVPVVGTAVGGKAGFATGIAANTAAQVLDKYKASYIEALQSGLSEEQAREEARYKAMDTVPIAFLENLIPTGKVSRAFKLDKLIEKGIIQRLPNGMMKVLNTNVFKRVVTGAIEEGTEEGFEEAIDIAIEQGLGYRPATTVDEVISRIWDNTKQGAITGGVVKAGAGKINDVLDARRQKKAYEKIAASKDALTNINNAQQQAASDQQQPAQQPAAPDQQQATPQQPAQQIEPTKGEYDGHPYQIPSDAAHQEKLLSVREGMDSTDPNVIYRDIKKNPNKKYWVTYEGVDEDGNTFKMNEQMTGKDIINNWQPQPKPAKKSTTTKKPSKKKTVPTKQPVTQEPVSQEQVKQEPIAQEQVKQEPVTQEPVAQEQVKQEPVTQEPVAQEQVKQEQPVAQEEPEPIEDAKPVDEEKTTKQLDDIEQNQRNWFDNTEVKDSEGNLISYDDVKDDETYTYTDDAGKKHTGLGVELLNKATGDPTATHQPKNMVITDDATGKQVKLSKIALGGNKTYTITVDGNEVAKNVSGKEAHKTAGLTKRVQITSHKNADGSTTTTIVTPSTNQVKGGKSNLKQTIKNGGVTTTLTPDPAKTKNKQGSVERQQEETKQLEETREAAQNDDDVKYSKQAKSNRSKVPGSANPGTFGVKEELNNDQNTMLGKPDTVPTSPEETKRVMDVDLESKKRENDKLEAEYGVTENKTLEDLGKAGAKIPPVLYKNKVRWLVNKLAGIMDTVILDKLSKKGIAGKKVDAETLGATSTKLRYSRVKDSMDYESALHEIAHNVWQSGSDLDNNFGVKGIKELAKDKGIKLETLNGELAKVFPLLNSKTDLSSYAKKAITEEMFGDVYAKYLSDRSTHEIIKKNAPTVAALIDAHIDSMPEAKAFIEQMRDLIDIYNNLSPEDRMAANIQQIPTQPETLVQKASNALHADWWSRWYTRLLDNSHYARRVANHLAERAENNKISTTIRSITDAIEYIQNTTNGDISAMLQGQGITADGTSLGTQFKSVAAMMDYVRDVAKGMLPKEQQNDAEAIHQKTLEIDRHLSSYLAALDTLGAYTGNRRVMRSVRAIVDNTGVPLETAHTYMRLLSTPEFWTSFRTNNEFTKDSLTDDQIKALEFYKIDPEEFVKFATDVKKGITFPSAKQIATIAKNHKAYTPAYNKKVLDLEKARNIWFERNYKLPLDEAVVKTGFSLNDALKTITERESGPDAPIYKQMANDYYTYQEAMLDLVGAYSRGGKTWVEHVRDTGHAYHIPLLRMFENNEQESDYPEVSEQYRGYSRHSSSRPIRNIWDSTIKQTEAMIYGAHQSRVKEALVQMAEAFGGGKYIQEVSEDLVKVNMSPSKVMGQIKHQLEERIQTLKDQGLYEDILNEDDISDLVSKMYKLNMTQLNLFVPVVDYNTMKEKHVFNIWDPDKNTMRFFQVDPDVWLIYERNSWKPGGPIGKFLYGMTKMFVTLQRKFLIDWNPVFTGFTNPHRDALSVVMKGDANFFESYGYLYGLYWNALFHPEEMQKWYNLVERMGLGFNTRRSTYDNIAQDLYRKDTLPQNPIRRLFSLHEKLVRLGDNTDKWGRIIELKAYMKRHNITPEQFDISASRAGSLSLTKKTLTGLGITEDKVSSILTPEQLEDFRKAKGDTYLAIDLNEEQQKAMDKLVKTDEEISKAIKDQEVSFDMRVKLNRAMALATTDFARGGALSRSLNSISLFSQAALNGNIQRAEGLRRKLNQGEIADVAYKLMKQFITSFAMAAFGFFDWDEPYENQMRYIRFKPANWLGLDFTFSIPIQAPDNIMTVLGMRAYKNLVTEDPETVGDLIRELAKSMWPYDNIGGIIGLGLDAATGNKVSRLQPKTPIVNPYLYKKYMENKKHPPQPERIVSASTGRFAVQLAKWSGVPAAKIQYLMNTAGLGFWDSVVEGSVGFDSGTYTTNGQWMSTSGGLIDILKQKVGIDRRLYKTSYEIGIETLADEAAKQIEGITYPRTKEEREARRYAISTEQARELIKKYNQLMYIARDPKTISEVRAKKAEAARNMYKALVDKSNVNKSIINSYIKDRTIQYNRILKENIKNDYAEKKAMSKNNPMSANDIISKIWENTLGANVSQAEFLEGANYWRQQEEQKNSPTGKNTLKQQLITEHTPSSGAMNKIIKKRVAPRVNSKGTVYYPEDLQEEVRQELRSNTQKNINSAVEKTILAVASALERVGSPTRSSIRSLKVEDVMNNDTFKKKLHTAYLNPITFKDVNEAIAETLVEKTITYPGTAKFESGGKLWSTKPESKKITITDKHGNKKQVEVGGFGLYQLDPFAKGGHEKMREYINQSTFKQQLSEAYDSTKEHGMDYKKLSDIWTTLSKDPITAEAFAKDYESYMLKEYLPQSRLDLFKERGYNVDNPNVRDAIMSYSVQGPTYADNFAKSLPLAKANSVPNERAIRAIMSSKRNHSILDSFTTRYNNEEKYLINKERSRR